MKGKGKRRGKTQFDGQFHHCGARGHSPADQRPTRPNSMSDLVGQYQANRCGNSSDLGELRKGSGGGKPGKRQSREGKNRQSRVVGSPSGFNSAPPPTPTRLGRSAPSATHVPTTPSATAEPTTQSAMTGLSTPTASTRPTPQPVVPDPATLKDVHPQAMVVTSRPFLQDSNATRLHTQARTLISGRHATHLSRWRKVTLEDELRTPDDHEDAGHATPDQTPDGARQESLGFPALVVTINEETVADRREGSEVGPSSMLSYGQIAAEQRGVDGGWTSTTPCTSPRALRYCSRSMLAHPRT